MIDYDKEILKHKDKVKKLKKQKQEFELKKYSGIGKKFCECFKNENVLELDKNGLDALINKVSSVYYNRDM